MNSFGQWFLHVDDYASGDTGTLNSWSLDITTSDEPVITCSPVVIPFQVGCDTSFAQVGAGPEFIVRAGLTNVLALDVGDESVTITNANNNAAGIGFGNVVPLITLGDLFSSNDSLATLLGIANFSATGVNAFQAPEGFVAADITVGSNNSITMDFANALWDLDAIASFDLVFDAENVPEPGTLAMLGVGLAGIGFARRRTSSVKMY